MPKSNANFGDFESAHSVDDEAAQWVARVDRGLDAVETRQLARWRSENAQNDEAFLNATAAWKQLNRISEIPGFAASTEAILLRAQERRTRRDARLWWIGTFAAAAVLVVTWMERAYFPHRVAQAEAVPSRANYRVVEGTAKRQVLQDGSVVELNGDSHIVVAFTAEERRVSLLSGEAHFFVAKDAHHPFLVTAGGVTVRAVGTAFNVRLEPTSVEVLVTEGKIQLRNANPTEAKDTIDPTPPSMVAGERAVLSRAGVQLPLSIVKADAHDLDQALSWQSTRLIFDATPLTEVVAAFNHYNTNQLILGTESLRTKTLSGVFRADNSEGFVRLLQASLGISAQRRTERETVLFPIAR